MSLPLLPPEDMMYVAKSRYSFFPVMKYNLMNGSRIEDDSILVELQPSSVTLFFGAGPTWSITERASFSIASSTTESLSTST